MPPPNDLQNIIAAIHEDPPLEAQSRETGQIEESALMNQIAFDIAKEKLKGLSQDREERKSYANKTFKLVCCWIFGVFCVLLLQGFLSKTFHFHFDCLDFNFGFNLPESVLLAVVGGTTVSVIGIFLVVANYLFPKTTTDKNDQP